MRYRWKAKKKIQLQPGERRVVTKYLWFPKTLERETRWLEKSSWIEEVKLLSHTIPESRIWWKAPEWVAIKWDSGYDEF